MSVVDTIITRFVAEISAEMNRIQADASASSQNILQRLENLTEENANIRSMNDHLTKDRERLQQHIVTLEEDLKSFTKVSKIIALENENTRLKLELESARTSSAPAAATTPMQQQQQRGTTPPPSSPPPTSETATFSYKEKRVGAKTYWVDTNGGVFTQNEEDNSVGDQVGVMKKENGKTKIVWNY